MDLEQHSLNQKRFTAELAETAEKSKSSEERKET